VGCDIQSIAAIARSREIAVVEDNALGMFGTTDAKPLGTFGRLAAQSFHETKSFSCGEGGALLVNDPAYVERAEIIREKGTDRSRFLRGQIDKYTWVDLGSSYVMSDILAAFLLAQLEERDRIRAMRQLVWERYHESLAKWAEDNGVGLPVIPANSDPVHAMFAIVLPTTEDRTRLIGTLRARGVLAVIHYVPLHDSSMGRRLAPKGLHLPVTEDISARLLRLPFYNDLAEHDQSLVIDIITAFRTA
jgi:dTDP-4-amino-4,6-dideoxygalactose transaminase